MSWGVREWLELAGIIALLAGTIYTARRAGRSSDRVQQVALQVKKDEAAAEVSAAENSGYTRAQKMIAEAAEAQQRSFDATVARMERQLAQMQEQLDDQADEIRQLKQSREKDRRVYTRYIQKLLDLLENHKIAYPTPPPFFDAEDDDALP